MQHIFHISSIWDSEWKKCIKSTSCASCLFTPISVQAFVDPDFQLTKSYLLIFFVVQKRNSLWICIYFFFTDNKRITVNWKTIIAAVGLHYKQTFIWCTTISPISSREESSTKRVVHKKGKNVLHQIILNVYTTRSRDNPIKRQYFFL